MHTLRMILSTAFGQAGLTPTRNIGRKKGLQCTPQFILCMRCRFLGGRLLRQTSLGSGISVCCIASPEKRCFPWGEGNAAACTHIVRIQIYVSSGRRIVYLQEVYGYVFVCRIDVALTMGIDILHLRSSIYRCTPILLGRAFQTFSTDRPME